MLNAAVCSVCVAIITVFGHGRRLCARTIPLAWVDPNAPIVIGRLGLGIGATSVTIAFRTIHREVPDMRSRGAANWLANRVLGGFVAGARILPGQRAPGCAVIKLDRGRIVRE